MSAQVRNILMVCPDLGWGGIALNTFLLGREFLRRGLSVLVVSLMGGPREALFKANDIECIVHPSPFGFFTGRQSMRTVRDFHPDIVQAMALPVAEEALWVRKHCGARMAVTINRFLGGDMDLRLLPPEVPCIAVSDALQAQLINRFRVARSRLRVISNGIDPRDYPLADAERTRTGRFAPVVATQGLLTPEKGQRVFLHAAQTVLHQIPDTEFLVMGEGPDLPALRQLAGELGIARRVTFAGQDRIGELALRDIDIFVEPTTNEGFGLAVLQAMAWARPVIASGVGGLYSLIDDGRTGVLVPKGDRDALAGAIAGFLRNPARARELGMHGREHVLSAFNISNMADRYLELYAEMLDSAAGGAA